MAKRVARVIFFALDKYNFICMTRGETFHSLLVARSFLLIARYFLLVAQQEILKDFF